MNPHTAFQETPETYSMYAFVDVYLPTLSDDERREFVAGCCVDLRFVAMEGKLVVDSCKF